MGREEMLGLGRRQPWRDSLQGRERREPEMRHRNKDFFVKPWVLCNAREDLCGVGHGREG